MDEPIYKKELEKLEEHVRDVKPKKRDYYLYELGKKMFENEISDGDARIVYAFLTGIDWEHAGDFLWVPRKTFETYSNPYKKLLEMYDIHEDIDSYDYLVPLMEQTLKQKGFADLVTMIQVFRDQIEPSLVSNELRKLFKKNLEE